ncbi:hypothetical protein BDD12DRAFT_874025 [Trichophaea hybrida]|nr:hypothetical protein BDD12DRAFT_874025 [Trichophaea hybrida]
MASTHSRSLYRHLLRELPPIMARRTSLHRTLRQTFYPDARAAAPPAEVPEDHAKHFLKYLQSQRMYVMLLERYNPGLAGDMDLQEHTRLTARRVGLDMPVQGEREEE